MHEVSFLEGVIDLVRAEARIQPFARVRVVRLRLGTLGHAEPEALRFCFDAVTSGTLADGARLEIEMVQGQGWCSGCQRAALMEERISACPVCGRIPLTVVAGDECLLAELEVE
jgi:hydrogenase nickel incorporation protein HypA/HybF